MKIHLTVVCALLWALPTTGQNLIFADGFETGDGMEWSSVVQ